MEVCGGWDDVAMLEEGRRQLAPLYYPDTLVNPDTSLGLLKSFANFIDITLRLGTCIYFYVNCIEFQLQRGVGVYF